MFNGSRFFNLLRKWKGDPSKCTQIYILQDVMNHYFDSLAGHTNSNTIRLSKEYFTIDIAIVLDAVGYFNYSIGSDKKNKIVTLRNNL